MSSFFDDDDSNVDPPHPLGVLPAGNFLWDSTQAGFIDARRLGLGILSHLDDEAMLNVLEYLDGRSLCLFGGASRVAYAFATHDDTWRALVLRSEPPWDFTFTGSWRGTGIIRASSSSAAVLVTPPFSRCGLYSATLFHAHRSATARIRREWGEFDNLPRPDVEKTTAFDFRADFELGVGRPALLVGAVKGRWPGWAPNGGGAWSGPAIVAKYGSESLHAGGFDPTIAAYAAYAAGDSGDQAMYIFDAEFADKVPGLGSYSVPPAFPTDLFALLHPQDRPHYRWLIMGPKKSGSVFHQDPNGTSAWNACLAGAKLWILLPPDLPPPGVWASADGAHACAPLSVVEWYLQFWEPYKEMRDRRIRACDAEEAAKAKAEVEVEVDVDVGGGAKRGRPFSKPQSPLSRPYSGIALEGDVVYIPHGWWHCVLNIGEGLTVAVTQNFCSPEGLPQVLKFLKEKPLAISGTRDDAAAAVLGERFRRVLEEKEPEELARADAILAEDAPLVKTSRWARITTSTTGGGGCAPGTSDASSSSSFSFAALWGATT